jgi:hypothetical protein
LEEQKGLVTCAHALSRDCVTNNIEIVCFCESTASNVTLFLSSASKHLNIYDGMSIGKWKYFEEELNYELILISGGYLLCPINTNSKKDSITVELISPQFLNLTMNRDSIESNAFGSVAIFERNSSHVEAISPLSTNDEYFCKVYSFLIWYILDVYYGPSTLCSNHSHPLKFMLHCVQYIIINTNKSPKFYCIILYPWEMQWTHH